MRILNSMPVLCVSIILTITGSVCAQNIDQHPARLKVGDEVPELKIEQWVKGGGFVPLEKGKTYLIDFWATWCVPCIAGMPHLSQLQSEYKDKGLVIRGVTNQDHYGNTLENVRNFVKKKDSLMNYNVAWVPRSARD